MSEPARSSGRVTLLLLALALMVGYTVADRLTAYSMPNDSLAQRWGWMNCVGGSLTSVVGTLLAGACVSTVFRHCGRSIRAAVLLTALAVVVVEVIDWRFFRGPGESSSLDVRDVGASLASCVVLWCSLRWAAPAS